MLIILKENKLSEPECVDFESILTGPNRKACKKCDVPIHVKCAIANGLMLDKKIIAVMITYVMMR